MNLDKRFVLSSTALAAAMSASLFSGCGGGGGSDTFTVDSISVQNDQVWRINRPIEIDFNQAVDLNSVNLNTVQIRAVGGAPSAGEFAYGRDSQNNIKKNVIIFQPLCPKLDDFSDAGFKPGGTQYELKIVGAISESGAAVLSTSGTALTQGHTVFFTTPTSPLKTDIFFDPKKGGPLPKLRTSANDTNPDCCYVEVGGDPTQRVYFGPNGQLLPSNLLPGGTLPLNLSSDATSKVALVIFFDQPIDPSSSNISTGNLRWQYPATAGAFASLPCDVTLVANCIDGGAVVRVEPQGTLPPGVQIRGFVRAQFSDLVGETNTSDQTKFALSTTSASPAVLADEVFESFDTAAHLDTTFSSGAPQPQWGGGSLSPSFAFGGTGGPNGNFDLLIPAGNTVIFDTVSSTFTGGPNFVPTTTSTAVGGVLDVRNLRVEAGATFKIQGPNPATILTTGTIEIFGTIDASGTDNPGVATLDTTNIPESGATGQAGGGRGGTGSPLTNASSPKGGNGFGAFGQADAGGTGGETGWNDIKQAVDLRRGSGGGGGVLGANQLNPAGSATGLYDQHLIGLDAEKGFDNLNQQKDPASGCASDPNPPKGALTGICPPTGGLPGPGPFGDLDPTNDFWGTMISSLGVVTLGELKKPWAGAGGGGGGDASFTAGQPFPKVPFSPTGDEKGAGGGGGAGSVHVMSLGNVVFGASGSIVARGGTGGGGENTIYLNRVGGGSGGGSGGHVIIETAAKIDLSAATGATPAIFATGGEGGAGRLSNGGSTPGAPGSQGTIEQTPANDACPNGYPTTGANACLGVIDGAGGDGGPGIIQLHVNDNTPGADLLLPAGKTLDQICAPTPLAATLVGGVPVARLIPTFGRVSRGRSTFYPTGFGGFDSSTFTFKPLTVDFQGTDPNTGLISTSGGQVSMLAPLIAATHLDSAHVTPPYIDPDPSKNHLAIVLDATSLVNSNSIYVQNAALLKGFLIELVGSTTVRFEITQAKFIAATGAHPTPTFAITVASPGLGTNLASVLGNVTAALVPAYFRVVTKGVADDLPASASVLVQFEAAPADAFGNPDTTQIVGPFTDVSQITDPNGLLRFLRFDVTFDIDVQNAGLSTNNPRPSLSYLKIPFKY